jgi:hypothetical protein
MPAIFFVMVLLFATPDGGHHEAFAFFDTKAACEAAKPAAAAKLINEAGAIEVGAACTDQLSVGKVS